eukprot:Platyproteum_vivax@DN7004_c0_g1_i3.p1
MSIISALTINDGACIPWFKKRHVWVYNLSGNTYQVELQEDKLSRRKTLMANGEVLFATPCFTNSFRPHWQALGCHFTLVHNQQFYLLVEDPQDTTTLLSGHVTENPHGLVAARTRQNASKAEAGPIPVTQPVADPYGLTVLTGDMGGLDQSGRRCIMYDWLAWVKHNSGAPTLKISDNDAEFPLHERQAGQAIIGALRNLPKLSTLWISSIDLGNDGVAAMAGQNEVFPLITSIRLNDNDLQDAGLKALAENWRPECHSYLHDFSIWNVGTTAYKVRSWYKKLKLDRLEKVWLVEGQGCEYHKSKGVC